VAADGSIVADPDYGTYDESTVTADYSYTGKEMDSATGLVNMNTRWYDLQLGRFISEDSVKDGTNWYVYCKNNPLKFTDPTGLSDRCPGMPSDVEDRIMNGSSIDKNNKSLGNDFGNTKTVLDTAKGVLQSLETKVSKLLADGYALRKTGEKTYVKVCSLPTVGKKNSSILDAESQYQKSNAIINSSLRMQNITKYAKGIAEYTGPVLDAARIGVAYSEGGLIVADRVYWNITVGIFCGTIGLVGGPLTSVAAGVAGEAASDEYIAPILFSESAARDCELMRSSSW
jgi:RHS repeat-associated protein